MQVAFLSEGATELGIPGGQREGERWPRASALQILVERILGAPGEIEPWIPTGARAGGAGAVLARGRSYLLSAARAECRAAVLLVDADRKGPDRLRRLRAIRNGVRSSRSELAIPTAIGVAVEKFEAWLLADEGALCRVLGLPNPAQPMRSPEELKGKGGMADDARAVLADYLAKDTRGPRTFLEQAHAIAAQMDVDVLAERCPKGFARFRQEVEGKLGPLLGSARPG